MCRWFHRSLMMFLFASILLSCTKVPDGVISQNTMEKILYDFYIGESISETELASNYDVNARKIYFLSVLKKYEITKEEYNASLNWYLSNLSVYTKVYERVLLRLKKEEAKIKLETGDLGKSGVIAKGDTVDLWNKTNNVSLGDVPLIGNLFVNVQNDESFIHGDSIQFSAFVRMFNKSNRQKARMVLTIAYQNDSTQTFTEDLIDTKFYSIRIKTDTMQRLNNIVAGFYQCNPGIVSVDRIKLMRIHLSKKVR